MSSPLVRVKIDWCLSGVKDKFSVSSLVLPPSRYLVLWYNCSINSHDECFLHAALFVGIYHIIRSVYLSESHMWGWPQGFTQFLSILTHKYTLLRYFQSQPIPWFFWVALGRFLIHTEWSNKCYSYTNIAYLFYSFDSNSTCLPQIPHFLPIPLLPSFSLFRWNSSPGKSISARLSIHPRPLTEQSQSAGNPQMWTKMVYHFSIYCCITILSKPLV